MTHLQQHNHAELPLIAQMYNNELHLMREAFQGIDETDPDVQAALADRIAELTIQEGQNMAELVD